MIVGCYTVHLYCDFGKEGKRKGDSYKLHGGIEAYKLEHVMEFTGRTEGACFKEARKRGWRIYKAQGKAKCPSCSSAAAPHEQPKQEKP